MAVVLTVTGPVHVTDDATGGPLTDPKRLGRIAKLKYNNETISEYFGPDLSDVGITGGDIRLASGEDGLTVTSTFKSPRPLTPEETALLVKEATGQWSDGIGEGCFDDVAGRLGVEIDLCPDRSRVAVTAVDDGKPVRAKSAKQAADERLLKASRAGDLEGVKAALAAGANLEARDKKMDFTPLHWSTWGGITDGHTAVSLFLIAAGVNVNAKGNSSTPLENEVRRVAYDGKSSLEVIRALLAAGADPNRTYRHDRVLTMAKNHPELREILLAAGAIESNWVLREQAKQQIQASPGQDGS